MFLPEIWVDIVEWLEIIIGITFLSRKTVRLAILFLAFQMVGTFLPLLILPEVTFHAHHVPYGLILEGQYIINNLLIISAALIIGGTVRERKEQ